jgi:hypothetical protein
VVAVPLEPVAGHLDPDRDDILDPAAVALDRVRGLVCHGGGNRRAAGVVAREYAQPRDQEQGNGA